MSSPSYEFDFASFLDTPAHIRAPNPEDFDYDIDLIGLADYSDTNLWHVVHKQNDIDDLWLSAIRTHGPSSSSAFTESTYDSQSSHAGSVFNYPASPSTSLLDMELLKMTFDPVSDYAAPNPLPDTMDPTSFGAPPPTPPHSPPVPAVKFTSFSDYGGISTPAFFDPYTADTTVSPSRVTSHIPITDGLHPDTKLDSRKKHKCSTCPRCNFISSLHLIPSDDLFVLPPSFQPSRGRTTLKRTWGPTTPTG